MECMFLRMNGNLQVQLNYALHVAVRKKDRPRVQELLTAGTDVNLFNEEGHTPLYIAVEQNLFSIAEVLLNNGANPNLSNGFRISLHIAVQQQYEALIKLLLHHGADPNFKDFFGCTSLHIALETTRTDLVEMLLEHRADPNLPDNHGNSALHYFNIYLTEFSSRDENIDTLRLLLDYLAYPDIINEDGLSALHFAVESRNIGVVRKLLACGADPNSTDREGNSVLHMASSYYFDDALEPDLWYGLSIVQALLEAGADVAATDMNGRTALHLTGCQDVALCLLDKGAPIDAQDNKGETPLHYAAIIYHKGNPMEPLLFAGANLDIADDKGKTSFQIIQNCKDPNMNIVVSKFAAFNMKRNVTSRFDLTWLNNQEFKDYSWMQHEEIDMFHVELEKVKYTRIEGMSLYDVLKYSLRNYTFLHNKAFRTGIEKEEFEDEFPNFYLLIRMCVRETEILKPLVDELSDIFAFKLTTTMGINVPQEVCCLIIIELESVDIKNLKIALC